VTRKILVTGGSGFIGTNFIDLMLDRDAMLFNVDIRPPIREEHHKLWKECDLLDQSKLRQILSDNRPTEVVHLAARTDTIGTTIEDYRANTEGTANLLAEIKEIPSISRVIITSTQFVYGPGSLPKDDVDFSPHTVYGRSKVLCEQMTRAARLECKCTWTIVRPTNIWGPWHPRYPNEFWKVLKRGLYIHPGKTPVIRSYGYVWNVAHQIAQILESAPILVNKKVFYLGDPPGPILDWVNAFSRALTGREVRTVPRSFVRILSIIGDALSRVGVPFPIYTSRFQSMTQDYLTPMGNTFSTFGLPPFSLDEGVRETVLWLKRQSAFWN
jgi:nucleoside-diphosphate-sugar epimerase